VLSLLTCLALLRPDAAVAAACHKAESDSSACCAVECGCCEQAGNATACCCEGDDAPADPIQRRAPAPTSTSTELARALGVPGPALPWEPASVAQESRAPHRLPTDAPPTSGRTLLRQGCRLRH